MGRFPTKIRYSTDGGGGGGRRNGELGFLVFDDEGAAIEERAVESPDGETGVGRREVPESVLALGVGLESEIEDAGFDDAREDGGEECGGH